MNKNTITLWHTTTHAKAHRAMQAEFAGPSIAVSTLPYFDDEYADATGDGSIFESEVRRQAFLKIELSRTDLETFGIRVDGTDWWAGDRYRLSTRIINDAGFVQVRPIDALRWRIDNDEGFDSALYEALTEDQNRRNYDLYFVHLAREALGLA
jgi:hypothetical protein